MTSTEVASHLATLLIGVFTGTAGKYFADKYTDKRQSKEKAKKSDEQFRQVASKMPAFIECIQNDLKDPEYSILRDFFIVPKESMDTLYGKHLAYYEDDNLSGKIVLLENHRYVENVASSDAQQYRMTEEFVSLILRVRIKNGQIKI